MYKRRLAVLGAAAVLAITGLAGSAMADEAPPAGGKVTCMTSDGKPIEVAEFKQPMKLDRDGKVTKAEPGKAFRLEQGKPVKVLGRDGKPIEVKPGVRSDETVELSRVTEGDVVPAKPLPADEFPDGRRAVPSEDAVRAQPAEPGADVPEGVAKPVKVICKKAE
ncbi:hypothetical protein ITP53_07675 [Nonomuraea sp. K274]|uniref:Uncharacterized protein n=1 Tax=Nonomuraea cypriaca TaxID=1187855 RepID=A0A931EXL6_9ACTN|nr:hypothetical protein [Nonomuraea cypriaca]MBF8185617.1 hypothetical protein [Nonomuraea cypriaca]